ncbi:MAG: hypothetical protein ACFFB5_04080 [Promethearchaeota archaeon]
MSSVITELSRIPWKEYLKSQIYKILGLLVIALLIIGVMFVSQEIDLSSATIEDPAYLVAVVLSSLCFFCVLIGFSKIVLFDMATEFGLRNEETNEMVYNARFFLFAALALSFCSAIYLLLDVFLYQENPVLDIKPTYLELLPVLAMEWVLVSSEANIPGLTEKIGTGKEFYQTARNIYFDFFFLVIIAFSVLIFLSILTTLARNRVTSRFRKEEVDEEEENKRLYKILAWLGIPIFGLFLFNLLATPIAPIVGIILIGMILWWIYQLVKFIFLILWRGLKVTAFITSVNFLLIIPLIGILYLLPVISWTIWDILFEDKTDLWVVFITRAFDIINILQLDFVFITLIATVIVGFAEGFAIVAIFTAIFKGVEVARTGRVIARSPPKIAVIMKYLIMFSAWLGLFWNSLRGILQILELELNLEIDLEIPSLIYLIYDELVLPLSEWFMLIWPTFKYVPFLLLPLYFIIAAAFKFLSITIVTPRVKERLSIFFLLISTAFVLIITNILGDIYELHEATPELYADAPLLSQGFVEILFRAVLYFEYVESVAFYAGFIFGLGWVIRKIILSRRPAVATYEPKEGKIESIDLSLASDEDNFDVNEGNSDSNELDSQRHPDL